jgi:hypothetical protein
MPWIIKTIGPDFLLAKKLNILMINGFNQYY